MEGGHLPYCEDCIVPLTVKHILIQCPTFNNESSIFYNNINLEEILTKRENINKLYNFLNAINLLGKF